MATKKCKYGKLTRPKGKRICKLRRKVSKAKLRRKASKAKPARRPRGQTNIVPLLAVGGAAIAAVALMASA